MAKWINFVLIKEGEKTNVWHVIANRNGNLGVIRWFPHWRKYAFFPFAETVYENDCLKDIAKFIEMQMRIRKNKK